MVCGNGIVGPLIILGIGVVFLLRNLGIIQGPVWNIIWPGVLIVIGIAGLLGRFGHRVK